MIVIILVIITELSKSRTAHGGCAPLGLFDDREAWRRGGGLVRRFGKEERTPRQKKQEKKPHEIV